MFQKRSLIVWLVLTGIVLLTAGCASPTTSVPSVPTPMSVPAVTAKGQAVPVRYVELAFSAGGTLAQVAVKPGQAVKAGDVLALLDMHDLELAVRAAQDDLAFAQSKLAQAKVLTSPEEMASAQATYDSAVLVLNHVKQGPSTEESVILSARLAKAQAALDRAQAAYDRMGGASLPFVGMLPQSLDLQIASLDYQIAQADFGRAMKADATEIADAQATVAQTRATLEQKKKGPRAEDVAVAQAGVQQAQTALEQAQAALAKARLVAPFDGIVAEVSGRVGERVQSGDPVVTVADLSQLRVETTDLDEFGTARVKLGQPVSLTVNALGDQLLAGKVEAIALRSVTLSTGDTAYVVTVALDNQDPDLRWGMTVKVNFGAGQ